MKKSIKKAIRTIYATQRRRDVNSAFMGSIKFILGLASLVGITATIIDDKLHKEKKKKI